MQTRSGEKFPPSMPHQTFKEVRIPFKKRHASAIDCPQLQEDAPASKKQKSHKAVRFEHKGHFPQDSWESEKKSAPSEEVFRRISIEIDESLGESEEEVQGEVLEANEADQCVMNTTEDSNDNELMAESFEESDEERITSLPNDFHDKGENNHLDHRAGLPENGNHQPISEERENAVVDMASSSSSPTNLTSRDIEFKQRYLDLKATAWHWSSTYFPPPTPTPGSTPPSLNLLDLCLTSPQLMEYVNYISVCTDSLTWEDIFNEQRTFLVYSILGKMIEVHIFGHEMFGATDEQLHILRAADEECIMDDGFHRQTQRANTISSFLDSPPHQTPPNFLPSLSHLQASFLQMLSPLLPTLAPNESQSMKSHLSSMLLQAATLSLSLRREPLTIYHWHMHPAPGSLYSSKSMHILDRDGAKEGREAIDVRVVTMAGWPSCVAYGATASGKGARAVGRAEVLVRWEARVGPLAVRPANWLGPRLRVEMRGRLERRDREERMAVVGSGLAVGAGLAMGWVVQQPWVIDTVKGIVGV